jgi:hypothetical protein
MRRFVWMSGVLAAVLLVASGPQMQGQDQPAGQGQGRGRGGFGGGQMGQRVQGIVTAATAGKVTIKTDTGDSYDITVSENSRVLKSGQPIKPSDVKVGDSVTAMGQVDATSKTVQAIMLMDIDAATLAKAKENMGKTYITGRITAIDADNLKLTVMRTDNVSQVVAVDDGTSFQRGNRGVAADVAAAGGIAGATLGGSMRRGGQGVQAAVPPAPESITLADVKVGDSLMATGMLKNGTFTALKMGVTPQGVMGGQGRRGPQGQDAPSAPAQPPAVPPQS